MVQMTPNWVVHFSSSSCSSERRQSSERPSLEVKSSLRTRLYSNFCRPLILVFSSSFFTVTSAFLFSRSSLFSLFLRLYLSLSQYAFSFSMAVLRLVQMSGFFTFGWPWMMNRQSLSQSSWMRSITLKNSALLDQMERNLKAFQYQFSAVLKSLSSVQMMPIISLISATLLESSPYCSSLSFRAFSKISRALGSSPCNLQRMPMLQKQSPANCPLMLADFLKHSMAFLKQPSSAQQQPMRKQQLEAQQESAPKKIMMILVQITQQLIHSMPIEKQRLPIQEIRFSFFWRYQQYFYFIDSFCLSVGTSFRSSISYDFSLRQFSSSCFALFLSLSSRQVLVSRQTVPPQSSSQLAEGLENSRFLSRPTSTFASRRHSENCLWLKFQQQLFLTSNIFFCRSSVGALLTWQVFLCPLRQCQNWWSLLQQKAFSHQLHWKRASLPQIQQPGDCEPVLTFQAIREIILFNDRIRYTQETNINRGVQAIHHYGSEGLEMVFLRYYNIIHPDATLLLRQVKIKKVRCLNT